jgi:PAS domain S-box-containing protein
VTISPIRNAAGAITNFLAIQQDITERKRIESDLRERETRFRQLAENISEVFFIMDADYRETLYINPAYESLFGQSCQSLYENPTSFLNPVPPSDQARVMESIAQTRAGKDSGPIEFEIRPPGGKARWVISHAVPIRNERGEVYRISGVVLDITERRAAEEALRQSERRLRTLFETVNLIVLILDAEARIEYLNPFALELSGYPRAEAFGQNWFELLVPQTDRAQMLGVFQEMLHGHRHAHYQSAIVTKRGEQRMIAWHNTVLRDDRGAPIGTLSVGEDVTEHALLEEQYRQAQKMEAIGQLAGAVAHDFNNLLTVILSYGALMAGRLPAGDPMRDDLSEITAAGERAAALTHQLLAFTRQQVLQPRVVSLNDVVGGVEKMLRRLIGEDVELLIRYAADVRSVLVDPGQIEQVIMNLVVNARDALPGGGKLTIETANVNLDAEYAADHVGVNAGPHVMLAVSDTGVGMDRATQARIFEPFFTTKGLGKGTGLGLSTVFGIVKQSGGSIWVYSEPGVGTTFKVYFPQAQTGEEGPAQALPTTTPAARGAETILLVEDDEAVRRVTGTILRRHGYHVLEAQNGGDALLISEQQSAVIHLLLSDVIMPRMSGRELANQLTEAWPTIKVLFMSGYTEGSIMNHVIMDADTAFIQKPIDPDRLVRKVREVLDAPAPRGRRLMKQGDPQG